MKSFRDLKVWEKSHSLALAAYDATANFPKLQIAMGSASELECHLLLSRDLRFLDAEIHRLLNDRVEEVKRMLASLARKVDEERSKFKG
jgi:hypothetical protein